MNRMPWIAFALAVCLGASTAQAFSIEVNPVITQVGIGAPTNLGPSIVVRGLDNGVALRSIDLAFQTGDSNFVLDDFIFGDPLGQVPIQETFGVGSNRDFSFVSQFADDAADLNASQPNTLTLGTFSFFAQAPGQTNFNIIFNSATDAFGNPIIPDTIVNGTLTTGAPVPEPSSIAAFAVGALMLLGFWSRRQRSDAPTA
jgi:hypothetical protein